MVTPATNAKEDRPRVVEAAFVAAAAQEKQLPPVDPAVAEIAFAGRSNVGKSSLLNALLQRKNLVRTSRTPGCTRAINVFEAALDDGFRVRLVDLPGYGYAKRSKGERGEWGPMLEGYLQKRARLDAVVLIVDVRRGLEDDDAQLVEFVTRAGRGVVVVATKLDKLPRARQKPSLSRVREKAGGGVIGFSGVTGEGRAALWARLEKMSAR